MEGFSKTLTRTDVSNRLELPTEALDDASFSPGQYTKVLSVTDMLGKQWFVDCCKRPTGHPKPSLRRGWLPLVRAKGIEVGDRVTFWKLDGDEFIIEVKRNAMRLFGQGIWVHLENLMI